MSTGDQTEYLRAKMAERGTKKTATFSVDGFDKWAESERPARVGGIEKIPAESQTMSSRIVGSGNSCGGGPMRPMRGGISAQDFLGLVPGLFDFFNKAKEFTAYVKEDLRNPDIMPEKYRASGEMIASTLEKIGLGKDPHVAMYESCSHMVPKGKHGGAKDWGTWFKEVGDKLRKAYDFFIKHKSAIHAILKMKSLNPPGFDYARKLEGFMTNVGLGKKPPTLRRGGYDVPMERPMEEPVKKTYGVVRKDAIIGPRETDLARRKQSEPYSNGIISWDEDGNLMKTGRKVSSMAKQSEAYGEDEYTGSGCGCGGAAPSKPKRSVNSERGAIVKKVMQTRGVSLGEASRIVKAEGLY